MEVREIIEAINRLSVLDTRLIYEYTENEGEITDITEMLEEEKEIINDMLTSGNAVDELGRYLASREEYEDILKAEAAKIASKRKQNGERIEFLKGVICEYLTATGQEAVKGQLYNFKGYESRTTSVNKDVLKALYEHRVNDAIRAAGIPAYVTVTLGASAKAAEGIELGQDAEIFDVQQGPAVSFTKPRRAK